MKSILIHLQPSKLLLKALVCLSVFLFISTASSTQIVDSEVEDGIKKLISPVFLAAGVRPEEIKLYVILDDSINAFVANGRNIFVSTKLITSFNDPDIFKGVIAHELGHIAGGHLARRDEKIREIRRQSIISMGLLGVAAALSGSPDAILGGALGNSHLFSRDYLTYSRSQEVAADQASVKFLHKSNNTVAGLLRLQEFFTKKEKEVLGTINPYSATHPLSESRLSTLRLALRDENSDYGSSAEERRIYSRIVAKLRGFIEDKGVVLYQGDLDFFAKQYELAILNFKLHNSKKAVTIIDSLISQEPKNGYLHELKAQILLSSGEIFEAIESYEIASSYIVNPISKAEHAVALANSVDLYEDAQERKRVLKKIVSLLEVVISSDIRNPYIFRMLATAYGKLGDLGYSNLMLAEEAVLLRRHSEAKRFAVLAKKYSKNRTRLKIKIDDLLNDLHNQT